MIRNALFLFLTSLFFLSGCSSQPPNTYNLLYPIKASKQQVIRYDGFRFLSTQKGMPLSVMVLSNPVEDGGFADIAIALHNDTNESRSLSLEDISVRSRLGELEIISLKVFEKEEAFEKPAGFDKLAPKMQAYGCASPNVKDNVTLSMMHRTEQWIWNYFLSFQKQRKRPIHEYLSTLIIKPSETKGNLFRVRLPSIPEKDDHLTILIKLKLDNGEKKKFKLILQSLR